MDSFYTSLQSKIKPTHPRVIESGQGAYFVVDGVQKLNFCSSHYLGLAVDVRLKNAAIKAIDMYGIGTGYRTLAGTTSLHVELEKKIAEFKGVEDSILLPSGYLANMAAIQTILTKEDIIISDELNHASIIDAIKLSGVKNKRIYRHRDMEHLNVILNEVKDLGLKAETNNDAQDSSPSAQNDKAYNPKILIVTDGVFSMDGDLAPLPEIVTLAKKYGALTMVDDAHGEGVLGDAGQGIVRHFGLQGQVDIEVGTLSKAFSVIGGFITGRKELITYYKQNARQFMFTSALTIPDTAALLEAVSILTESNDLVEKLWENARALKKGLASAGFDIGHSQSPITPIMLGDEELARAFAAELYDRDIYASAIVYPMVPMGASRIRCIPSASHSEDDISKAVAVMVEVGKSLRVIS